MDTQNLTKEENILLFIKTLLESDSNLCNFARYFDYGSISPDYSEWKTTSSIINNNNFKNLTQAIRFVKNLDSNFLGKLIKHCEYKKYEYNNRSECLDTLLMRYPRRCCKDKYSSRKQNTDLDLQSIMVNLDCNYKAKGTSILTALDFVCKNPRCTNPEIDFYKKLSLCLCRLIFVGDKCQLLALIDRDHIVYVSLKTLANIYTHDKSENKIEFNTIVLKLFKLIERCCIYFLRCTLPQYYNDIITANILNEIPQYDLTVDKRISLQSLDDIKFNDDLEINNNVKEIISEKINDIIIKLINKEYYISDINIPEIIKYIQKSMADMNKYNVDKAYKNGLMLHGIFTECGWQLVDKSVRESFINNSVTFREGHIYIKKKVDIIPHIAFLRKDGADQYRILKKHVLEEKKYYSDGFEKLIRYPYIIHTLYLDITEGVLYCDGRHPNVSNGDVCMGDLKGKVTFSKCTENEVKELLQNCEDLLKCINYTSAYSGEYCYLYETDENSTKFNGVEENENQTINDNSKSDVAKELAFVNSDDFTEETEDNEDNISENTESTNFVEIESDNEDDYEVEESSNEQ